MKPVRDLVDARRGSLHRLGAIEARRDILMAESCCAPGCCR
jgi:hypothetical protein